MNQWIAHKKIIQEQKNIQFQIFEKNQALTFQQVIDYWIGHSEFRMFYNELLKEAEFESFFWEHPPLVKDSLDQVYEFVLVKSTGLARVNPNPTAFKDYYRDDKRVATFPNLGRNALMVVPVPEGDLDYAHLGRFVRNAPQIQLDAFWKEVGLALLGELGQNAKWLSTHGMGVYWLHIRIDQIPKYYHYQKYKN